MTTRLLSFVIWGLLAASVVFWVNRFAATPAPVPGHANTIGPATVQAGALVRLFGAPTVAPVVTAAPVVADARFKLVGVVAPRAGQRSGWALLVVDDKPARSYALGSRVDTDLVVQAISHRQVDLGPSGGAATLSLTLPAVAEAARGIPAAPGPGPGPGRVAPMVGLPRSAMVPTGQPAFGAGQPFAGGVAQGATQAMPANPSNDQPAPGFGQHPGPQPAQR